MQLENLNNESMLVNWSHLPNITTLSQYLNRNELIELSSTCKLYRKRFERMIFEKINLIGYYYLTQSKGSDSSFSNNESLNALIELLDEDLGNRIGFVKEVSFNINFNNEFAKKFINLLSTVKKLKFTSPCYEGAELSLSILLNGLKFLENVEFCVRSSRQIFLYTHDKIFPKSLKSIIVYAQKDVAFYVPITETLDSSYINLTTLTITSNIMLKKLTCNMPNLKNVEVLNWWDLDNFKLTEFLGKNPQLIKLNTKFYQYDNRVIESILSLKFLTHWTLSNNDEFELSATNFPSNYSIKYLNFYRGVNGEIILDLIKSCKNLENLEFTERNFYWQYVVEWDELDRDINHVCFNKCHFSVGYINYLDEFQAISQIKFISGYNRLCMLNESNIGELNNYRVIPTISGKSELFSIKKIRMASI